MSAGLSDESSSVMENSATAVVEAPIKEESEQSQEDNVNAFIHKNMLTPEKTVKNIQQEVDAVDPCEIITSFSDEEASLTEDEEKDEDLRSSLDRNIFEPEISIEPENDHGDSDLDDEDDDDDDPSDEDFIVKKVNKNDDRERKYQCPLCGKFFLTSSAMNGHVAKFHGTTLGQKFTCHVCGAPGSSRASLKRHLIRTHKLKTVDHPELLTKKCVHCGIGFAAHLQLYEHIRSEHKEKLSEYNNCSWCPALMRAKASLQRHIRRAHPGKEDPSLSIEKCPFCEESFPSRFAVQRHVKSDHPDSPRHVCDICNATFKFPYMLTRHKVSHENPQLYEENRKRRKYAVTCEFCGRKFGSKPRLEYHIQVVHTNPPIKIYTCRMCGLTFPTAKQNNRHYRKVHRPERQKIHCGKCNITFNTAEECAEHRALHPNTCDVCQKQFLRRDSLREHLLIHSAPRHQCPHCSKKFTQRSNLKRHIRVHTGEKPYKCSFCNRRFSDKSACNSHTRVHTGYERSVCSICGASFSKKQRLNYHMRMHTGEGLLYCPLCMRPNTNSYSLRKHIESHQQPLTKALISIGFKPLLTADSHFVMRALQALTHASLQSMSRHENIPNSFIEEVIESRGGTIITASSLEKDVEECAEALTDMAKIEGEDTGLLPSVDEGSENVPFNLSRFLQGILEKESQKVRIDGRTLREKRGNLSNHEGDLSDMMNFVDVDYEENGELPATIGDELVKQCLEIIMKDEQSDEDDKDEGETPVKVRCEDLEMSTHVACEEMTEVLIKTENEDPRNFPVKVECEELKVPIKVEVIEPTQFKIKTEMEDESDFGFEEDQFEVSRGPFVKNSSESLKEIPKIKISRITKTEKTKKSKDFFVAEIIEKC